MRARLLNVATWIGAAIGGLFLVVALFCLAFGHSVVLFSTGSMSPTVPQGSLSLVKDVPAADIRVGDILTVDREGKTPITHRVIDVSAGPSPDQRVVRMQGDANNRPDADDYTIAHGRVQVFSIPGLAYPLQAVFGSIWFTAATFIAVGALITAAFWPARHQPSPEQRSIQQQ